jgi:hypothetical protein
LHASKIKHCVSVLTADMAYQAYNPLDKIHLVEDVVRALLARPITALPPPEPFVGAGLYALYYVGDFSAYRRIAEQNRQDVWAMPIYVDKAVPAGARKDGYGLDEPPGQVLYRRLCEHAASIQQTTISPSVTLDAVIW